MIPKKIHYCWFGGAPLTTMAKKCIQSWKKYCPDYDIIEWNESNYDIAKNQYMKEAYDSKKWGFVPDYARLDIIYKYGGIYLDTDVELVKPLDELLKNFAYVGCERSGIVALGLGFGAEKGNDLIYKMLCQYNELHFLNENGTPNLIPAPVHQTSLLKNYGLVESENIQEILGVRVYPKEYFNPYDFDSGKISLSKNTYSIHHYAASWTTTTNKINTVLYHILYRLFGKKFAEKIKATRKIFRK